MPLYRVTNPYQAAVGAMGNASSTAAHMTKKTGVEEPKKSVGGAIAAGLGGSLAGMGVAEHLEPGSTKALWGAAKEAFGTPTNAAANIAGGLPSLAAPMSAGYVPGTLPELATLPELSAGALLGEGAGGAGVLGSGLTGGLTGAAGAAPAVGGLTWSGAALPAVSEGILTGAAFPGAAAGGGALGATEGALAGAAEGAMGGAAEGAAAGSVAGPWAAGLGAIAGLALGLGAYFM